MKPINWREECARALEVAEKDRPDFEVAWASGEWVRWFLMSYLDVDIETAHHGLRSLCLVAIASAVPEDFHDDWTESIANFFGLLLKRTSLGMCVVWICGEENDEAHGFAPCDSRERSDAEDVWRVHHKEAADAAGS